MDVSENSGTPKSSILIGFSIINHPFWVPLFLETPIWGTVMVGGFHGSFLVFVFDFLLGFLGCRQESLEARVDSIGI